MDSSINSITNVRVSIGDKIEANRVEQIRIIEVAYSIERSSRYQTISMSYPKKNDTQS
ncbi:MAG: hypothetical protein ACXADY_22635 [Candidatus Hodarchaeales archaeon]|jgi:hypothetical protein